MTIVDDGYALQQAHHPDESLLHTVDSYWWTIDGT